MWRLHSTPMNQDEILEQELEFLSQIVIFQVHWETRGYLHRTSHTAHKTRKKPFDQYKRPFGRMRTTKLFSNRVGLKQSKFCWEISIKRKSESFNGLSRNILRLVSGLLTAHCGLSVHLFRMVVLSKLTHRVCDDE